MYVVSSNNTACDGGSHLYGGREGQTACRGNNYVVSGKQLRRVRATITACRGKLRLVEANYGVLGQITACRGKLRLVGQQLRCNCCPDRP